MVNTKQKNLACCAYEGCTRAYSSTFNLKRHIEKVHFGIKKFKCAYCEKHLSSKQNLIDHQNIHSGARPYQCDVPTCGIKFRQLSQFYLHKQMHNEADMKESNALIETFVNVRMLTLLIGEKGIQKESDVETLTQDIEIITFPKLKISGEDSANDLPGFAEVLDNLGVIH